MADDPAIVLAPQGRPRVLKAPAVRRTELVDIAQRLFLAKGYERTTINDVIDAAGLSKGAFYHHFRAKEDLLEAIAERYAEQALANVRAVRDDASLSALERLNTLLAMSREWKAENLPELRAMFTVLLRPDNAVLYHRIVSAVFSAMGPTLTTIIADGAAEGVFDVADAGIAAEALLWLGESRRVLIVEAMAAAEAGDVDGATAIVVRRIRAEEATVDRVLGLPPGAIQLGGSDAFLRSLMAAWVTPPP